MVIPPRVKPPPGVIELPPVSHDAPGDGPVKTCHQPCGEAEARKDSLLVTVPKDDKGAYRLLRFPPEGNPSAMEDDNGVHVIKTFDGHAVRLYLPFAVEVETVCHPSPELFQERVHITRLTLPRLAAIYGNNERQPPPEGDTELETDVADFPLSGGIEQGGQRLFEGQGQLLIRDEEA